MNRIRLALVAAGATLVAAGCATMGMNEAEMARKTQEVMRASFKEHGQAKLDRLDQDEAQRLCTQYSGKELPNYVAQSIELRQLETIKYPAKLMGEWKDGEKIAQSGRGKQYSDDPKAESGGNCYACHQLSPLEISYGTIGPSLYHFGKLRGYGPDIQKYAYGKIYNAQAFSACSNMPRFGHNAILTEEQIRDLVALLVDPNSPVNK